MKTKTNTISHEKRNVLQKMFAGYELFYWGKTAKTIHLNKQKSGEFGLIREVVKNRLFDALTEQELIARAEEKAGRTFYVLTAHGRRLCR